MSPNEQAQVRAILIAAKVKRSDLDWMVESCPSVERARLLYGRTYQPMPDVVARPQELYHAMHEAQRRVVAARRAGDEILLAEELQRLTTEIAIVLDYVERANQGLELPPLPKHVEEAIDLHAEVCP